jgi:hypothetical protein
MSVSIVLVPLAIAAVSAWQAGRADVDDHGRVVCVVQTRMRDQGLLTAALRDSHAEVSHVDDRIEARWQGVEAQFVRDPDGIWQSHFTGDVDIDRASSIVAAIDVAYGRQVQQAVLAKLRERAPTAGMSVTSETVENDDSVTLVLAVGSAR